MTSRIFCLFIILALLTGCKRRDPNPELSDPIYVDMLREQQQFVGYIAEATKKTEAAQKELELSEPRSIERKNAQNDLLKAQYQLTKATEMAEYIKIRLLQRKYYCDKTYSAGFDSGAPWPIPGEYEAYITNKKLVGASRNWSDRVPRPSRQEDPAAETKSPGEKSSESKH